MAHPLDAALADPWSALRVAFGDPLHPGGEAATEALLDRAGVGPGTRFLDVGCGAGNALALARVRGARAAGVERQPDAAGAVRGDLGALPVASAAVDVALAECVLCLADDVAAAAAELRRVLRPAGRLAVSDVVVDGTPPDLPTPIARALCLDGAPERRDLPGALESAGFAVEDRVDHRDDLLGMRDRAAERVDYRGLLAALGDRGRALLDGIDRLEAAIENGRVGYVSLVARPGT